MSRLVAFIAFTLVFAFTSSHHAHAQSQQTCSASTWSGLQTCNAQLNSGAISRIEVTGSIQCGDNVPCVHILNQNRGSISVGGTGVLVQGRHDAILISGSSDVRVENIQIDGFLAKYVYGVVNDSVTITGGSTRITIQGVQVGNSPGVSFGVGGSSSNITLSGNYSYYAAKYGILLTNFAGMPTDVLIQGNYIGHTCDAGIHSLGVRVDITGNTLENNHTYPCLPDGSGQPSGGGQIGVESGSHAVYVRYNTIRTTDAGAGVDWGIELAPNVEDIVVHENSISAAGSGGIIWDATGPNACGSRPSGSLVLVGNHFYSFAPNKPKYEGFRSTSPPNNWLPCVTYFE